MVKIDSKLWEGQNINILDKGPLAKDAVTRKFLVLDKYNVHLGYIRWQNYWRRYTFVPIGNPILDYDHMRELSDFLEERTLDHKKDWKTEYQLSRYTKKIRKKKPLTNLAHSGIV